VKNRRRRQKRIRSQFGVTATPEPATQKKGKVGKKREPVPLKRKYLQQHTKRVGGGDWARKSLWDQKNKKTLSGTASMKISWQRTEEKPKYDLMVFWGDNWHRLDDRGVGGGHVRVPGRKASWKGKIKGAFGKRFRK